VIWIFTLVLTKTTLAVTQLLCNQVSLPSLPTPEMKGITMFRPVASLDLDTPPLASGLLLVEQEMD
jgi:hypothetical protein